MGDPEVNRADLLADVAAGASTLNRSSCVRLPALVPAPVRATLAGPAALSWQEMAPQVGKVRQSGWVLPYLTEWVDPRVRIDHAYGLVYLPGEDVPLHGDDNVATGVVWYRVERGRISSGLTVVSWALTDCPVGSEGFRCVPGSHKASFDRPADGSVEELAVEVPVRAGDVIIFTEALVHGGCWRGAGSRRALFYKYAPGNWAHRASWSRCRGAAKPRVLEPPEGHQVGAWLRTARRDRPSETVIGPSSR
jgi:hypothetical protein